MTLLNSNCSTATDSTAIVTLWESCVILSMSMSIFLPFIIFLFIHTHVSQLNSAVSHPSSVFLMKTLLTHPLGELRVHHEVVDMLLRPGQLQLPRHHRHQQRRAARTLQHVRNYYVLSIKV